MCVFFPVRIYPSALFSVCASFRVRFFPMRLYTYALFSSALFSYVLFPVRFFHVTSTNMSATITRLISNSCLLQVSLLLFVFRFNRDIYLSLFASVSLSLHYDGHITMFSSLSLLITCHRNCRCRFLISLFNPLRSPATSKI